METPNDALECFRSTGIDVLVAGKVLIAKPEALRAANRAADADCYSVTPEMLRARSQYEQLRAHPQGVA